MAKTPRIRWLDEPKDKDYVAAESFLGLLVAPTALAKAIGRLHTAPSGHWAAKDVLRASGLAPLKPKQSDEVAAELEKVKQDRAISPILLVGGLRDFLVIADGYHRVSAAYRIQEDAIVPGRLLWLPERRG